ncbi:amino acid:proton symporter, partial [Staphylococcus arlettae]
GGSLWIIVYLIILAFLSFIGSKEFKGLNWIHYPYDFVVIIIVALIFYKLGTTSYFESIYFKRAKKINKDMTSQLKVEQKLDSTTAE